VAHAAVARADPGEGPARGPARELWAEGQQFWRAGDYARAADRFDRAYEIDHAPSLGLWVARSLERAGRLIAASARYHELSQQRLPADANTKDRAAQRDAQSERQQLLARIPSIVVTIDGAAKEAVSVSINGQPLASSSLGLQRQVDPGHVLVRGVTAEGVVESSIELGEGEVKPVRLSFGAAGSTPAPATRPAAHVPREHAGPPLMSPEPLTSRAGGGRRVVGYVAMGVGGAALLTGTVFGVLSLNDEARLIDSCPRSRCPPSLSSKVDAYESRKTIATVGLISGAALAATGIVLYLTAPRAERSAALGVVWLGNAAGLRGSF
jgi:hypothetical protein